MVDKSLKMVEIHDHIAMAFSGNLQCIFSDDNADKLILRLRVLNDGESKGVEEESDDHMFLRSVEENMLSQIALKGVVNIEKVSMELQKVM